MNNIRLLNSTSASLAILFSVATASALAGEGMGYSGMPAVPQTQEVKTGKSSSTNKSMRPEIVSPLKEAVDLANKKDFQGALPKVNGADAVADKTPLEEYNVAKVLGYISVQLHDYKTAGAAYHRVLATNIVPAAELPQILKTTLVLDDNNKNYHSAISVGEQLQQLGPMDTTSMETLSRVYFLGGDYSNAIKTARATVDLETANGGTPNQQPLEIIFDSQLKTGDQAGAKQTFAKMCALPSAPADCSALKKH